jgi:SagB-type dehydrogenase family enzyme
VACEENLSLRPGVYLAMDDGELLLFRRDLWRHSESFGVPDTAKRAVLRRLAERPHAVAELLAMVRTEDAPGEDVRAFLDALYAGGWLVRTMRVRGRDLYTVQPLRALSEVPEAPIRDLVLSRFAVLRREGDQIVVESPLAQAQIHVHDAEVTALIGGLVRPMSHDTAPGSLPAEIREQILGDMFRAGLVVLESDETGRETRQWRPHELWFHARSRMGNGGYFGSGFGRTNWAKQLYEPLSAKRKPFPGPAVDLYRPDLETLRVSDHTLTAVVEDRRSIRVHDDQSPITVDQLGELLYRCARIRRSVRLDGADYPSRPYPSGGSAYELELYPVVRRVSGLEQGIYHYDSHDHRLVLVREPGPEVARLLRASAYAAMLQAPPQVLIVVAARFGRLMGSYEELPYALILKHVGVLYQTIYLVATSMGLAACGLGGGDATAFNEATGLNYTAESSVGEFILGSRPSE